MSEEMSVKETKESVLAVILVGKFVIERLKDGADLGDAMALGQKLMDEEFRQVVQSGIEGADKIPAEMKDLSFMEGAELLTAISAAFLPKAA